MKKEELIELLDALAEEDAVDIASVPDHPCSVAIRAINKCFDEITKRDIEILGLHLNGTFPNSAYIMLPYTPEW